MMNPQDVLTGQKLVANMKPGTIGKDDLAWDFARAVSAAREESETEAKTRYASMLEAAIADQREAISKAEQDKTAGLVAREVAAAREQAIQVLEVMAAEIRKNSPGKEYLLALAIEKIRATRYSGLTGQAV